MQALDAQTHGKAQATHRTASLGRYKASKLVTRVGILLDGASARRQIVLAYWLEGKARGD